MSTTLATGHLGRVLAVRMSPGTDVMQELEAVCRKEKLCNAVILSGIGSLNGAVFMTPEPKENMKAGFGYGDPIVLTGAIEVLSLTGMVCHGDSGVLLHVHGTFSDQDGKCYGGHLGTGNRVLLTVDIVLAEIDGISMNRKMDDETGLLTFAPVSV